MCVVVVYDLLPCDVKEVGKPRVIAGDEPVNSVGAHIEGVHPVHGCVALERGGEKVTVAVMHEDLPSNVRSYNVAVCNEGECLIMLSMLLCSHSVGMETLYLHGLILCV